MGKDYQPQLVSRISSINSSWRICLSGGWLEKVPNIFLPNGGIFHGDESHGIESVKTHQLNNQK